MTQHHNEEVESVDQSILAHVRLNVGCRLLRSITDMIAAGAPISKSSAAKAPHQIATVKQSKLFSKRGRKRRRTDDNSTIANEDSNSCSDSDDEDDDDDDDDDDNITATTQVTSNVRRLRFTFRKETRCLEITSNESIDKDVTATACFNDTSAFSEYFVNWHCDLVVGVPMDAFRKMFSGMTDSCGGGTKSLPDPLDIYVRCDDGELTLHRDVEFVARRPRSITLQNTVTKSGCTTTCLLVSNRSPPDVSNIHKLLHISPVELVNMYAELGGVESTFAFEFKEGTMTVANHMGSATRKWRVFECPNTEEVPNFRMKLRSSIIHNIQKLKAISPRVVLWRRQTGGLIITAPLVHPAVGTNRTKIKKYDKSHNSEDAQTAPGLYGELVIQLDEVPL
ncbi:hypothetical protein F8203_gp188 [Heliothis virescens ascovirus 3f]|uniref:Uncharacterized protein n=1 Tax=Heliothis virescens ascovirus 3f TaxID=328614 RepID=A0A171PVR6_9VIRU|nr:hypothetical protein F8203_gp188 [Heliothis virescens ascovirus 3f]AJP09154.1 hypothetical protein [Heliothis virescens ascovirus 3f]